VPSLSSNKIKSKIIRNKNEIKNEKEKKFKLEKINKVTEKSLQVHYSILSLSSTFKYFPHSSGHLVIFIFSVFQSILGL